MSHNYTKIMSLKTTVLSVSCCFEKIADQKCHKDARAYWAYSLKVPFIVLGKGMVARA